MSQLFTAEEIRSVASLLEGWDLSVNFQLPTIEDIENDLELASPAWTGLLRRAQEAPPEASVDRSQEPKFSGAPTDASARKQSG